MILADAGARDALHKDLAPHLRWDPTDERPSVQKLARIFGSIDDPLVPGAIIALVRDDRMLFSVVADNPTDWRRLIPLAVAAAGVTLTDLDGRSVESSGPIAEILNEYGLQHTSFETPIGDRHRASKAVDALRRLILALQTMPVAPRDLPRSPPQLLHEFDLALQGGDRDASLARLRELEQQRAVDSLNLRFLTVRWHAAFQQWRELRDEPWFADLCQTRRPPRVTAELLRAIYEAGLGGAKLLADPGVLLERFRTLVAGVPGDLFRHLPPAPNSVTAIMFALDAATDSEEGRIAALRLSDTSDWDVAERRAFEAILVLGSPSDAPSTAEPELTLLELLRRRADGPPLSEAELTAVRGLLAEESGSLSVVELGNALIRDRSAQQGVPEASPLRASADLPDDWVTDRWEGWFRALPKLSTRRARELAERLADEVDVRTALAAVSDREHFANTLADALSTSEEQAVQGLPHVARWLQDDADWPTADLAPLYRALFTDFLIFDARTAESLSLALSLLDGWLSTGPQATEYTEALDDFRGTLGGLVSERTLDPLIDLAELLVIHPAQHRDARDSLWAELQSRLHRFQARMTPLQVAILNGICEVMGGPWAFEMPVRDEEAADGAGAWEGTVGIYSLRSAVGQRVVDALSERYPGARVDWRDDHVSSPSLRQWAARSDVVAVDWSAAKHPVTDAIRAALGDRAPLWVHGGTSSIVSKIIDAVDHLV